MPDADDDDDGPDPEVADLPSTLKIRGQYGDFYMTLSGNHSIPIQYIASHVGFRATSNSILKHLSIVREAFPLEDMSLGQILQRDIQDDRVSMELIPYLVKDTAITNRAVFFPPIVALLIPIEENTQMRERYSDNVLLSVEQEEDYDGKSAPGGYKWSVTTCGVDDDFDFSLQHHVKTRGDDPSLPLHHSQAQLNYSRDRCKLVVLDGQHRAMALLALYRNKNGWDRGAEYKHYYKHWKEQFELDGLDNDAIDSMFEHVNLPMIVCVAPTVSGDSPETIQNIARMLFVDLNQNAREIPEATLEIMQDNDLVSIVTRDGLDKVKSQGEQ